MIAIAMGIAQSTRWSRWWAGLRKQRFLLPCEKDVAEGGLGTAQMNCSGRIGLGGGRTFAKTQQHHNLHESVTLQFF
jgi:hypothetical protein